MDCGKNLVVLYDLFEADLIRPTPASMFKHTVMA